MWYLGLDAKRIEGVPGAAQNCGEGGRGEGEREKEGGRAGREGGMKSYCLRRQLMHRVGSLETSGPFNCISCMHTHMHTHTHTHTHTSHRLRRRKR